MTATATVGYEVTRELGRLDQGRPGVNLLLLGGIHGNEPAGVLAIQRVLQAITAADLPVTGKVVACAGNLPALAAGQRFFDRDLNRGWSAAALAELRQRAAAELGAEDREQLALLDCFEQVIATANGPVVFVDLHSSSADGPPFLCLADTIDNRDLGLATGVPIILGIEETIDGASLEWFATHGIAALAVEGGRHQHPATVANHEAVLWLLLAYLGILPSSAVALPRYRAVLRDAVAGAPPIVEIVHRQAITPQDRFVMQPGFLNFAPVQQGDLLASDAQGQVRASQAGFVLLPLYQALGDDGFFLARPVARFWLWLARWLRALRCDRLVTWLPGVRRDPADSLTILVNPRVARWFVTEVFHLLGFRKERRRGALLSFSRRFSRPENRRLRRGS